MIERLETTLSRYNEIINELSKPEVLGNVDLMTSLSKEQASIAEVVDKYKESSLKEAVEAIEDADLIILSMGSLFTSIIPNLICDEITTLKSKHSRVKYTLCKL